jgi:hypothetical protein
MSIVQAIAWLPEALRSGVFLTLIALVLWFVFVRRGLPALWHAGCRTAARSIDFGVGAVLRLEYTVTQARRRRGETPPRWAFALAGVSEALQDSAATLYERYAQPGSNTPEDEDGEGDQKPSTPAPRARVKRRVPWLLLAVILFGCTALWIVMDQLSPTSIARYRLSQASDPWRDVEEWAGVDSGRGAMPKLVRARRHHTLINVRVSCTGLGKCRGWVLLKKDSNGLVAVHYVDMTAGSTLVQVHLRPSQLSAARAARLVTAGV